MPVLIALGANLDSDVGPPAATINAAAVALSRAGFENAVLSRLYANPAHPPGSGPDYVNAALGGVTALSAGEALGRLHGIENRFGRTRARRWGARSLDLDLLALGDAVLPDVATFEQWRGLGPRARQVRAPESLILPHPRMQERAFVLIPLAEVAGDWRHPVSGRNVAEMLDALPDGEKSVVTPL